MARRADGNYSRLYENRYGDCTFFRSAGRFRRGFRPYHCGLDSCPWLQVGYVGSPQNPHAGHRIAGGPHPLLAKSPFRKGAIKGDRGPFYGVRGGCFSQAKTGEKTVFSAPFSGHLTS